MTMTSRPPPAPDQNRAAASLSAIRCTIVAASLTGGRTMRSVLLALVAGIAIGAAAAGPGHSAPAVLGSTAVSWDEIQAKPSGTGTTKAKQVFKDPTATLDELELHVSTLPPGMSP